MRVRIAIAAALALIALPLALAAPARGEVRRVVLITVDGARPGSSWAGADSPALAPVPGAGFAPGRAVTPALRTFPAMVALLIGRDPERAGVTDDWSRGAPATGSTLAASLAAVRFRSLALPADILLHSGTGIGRGFERFDTRSPAFTETARVDSALAWLRGPGRRFVWLDLAAEDPVVPWRRDVRPEWEDAAAYARRDAEIHAAIARLARGIAAMGGAAAVIAVGTRASRVEGEAPPPNAFAVPMAVRAPRGTRFARGPATLLDVAPTLLELAGAKPAGFEGRSLLGAGSGGTAPGRAPADAEAASCEAALREWLRGARTGYDSARVANVRALGVRCEGHAVAAIEAAVAVSLVGHEAEAAQLFQAATTRFAGDHRVALAYADHLIRRRRFEMVPGALAGITSDTPFAAEAAWRLALGAAASLDHAAARQAVAHASALAVGAWGRDAEESVARLAEANAAVDREPKNLDAKMAFGRALGDFGSLDDAYAQFNQVRFRDSTRVEAHYWIAHYLLGERRVPQAIAALERALQQDPGYRPARLALAEALASGEQWRLAIPHFERALEQDPADGRSHYNLACLKARAGETDAALAALGRALDAGYGDWAQIESDPDLEPVRRHPDFAALSRRRTGPR